MELLCFCYLFAHDYCWRARASRPFTFQLSNIAISHKNSNPICESVCAPRDVQMMMIIPAEATTALSLCRREISVLLVSFPLSILDRRSLFARGVFWASEQLMFSHFNFLHAQEIGAKQIESAFYN